MTCHARAGSTSYLGQFPIVTPCCAVQMATIPCGIVDKSKVAFAIDATPYCFDPLGAREKCLCVCVCVCVTADANSIVLISSVMRYDKCGDGSDLEKKVTSGSYRIKTGQKPPCPGHLPVSNLDLDLIYIIRCVLCCFIFSLVQIGCMYLIEGVSLVSVVFC